VCDISRLRVNESSFFAENYRNGKFNFTYETHLKTEELQYKKANTMIPRLTLCEASFKVLYRQPLVRLQNSVTPFHLLQNLISLRTLSYKCQGISIRNSTLPRISPLRVPFLSSEHLPHPRLESFTVRTSCIVHIYNSTFQGRGCFGPVFSRVS